MRPGRRLLLVQAVVAGLALAALAPARAGSYDDFFQAIDIDAPGIITGLLQRGFDPNTRSTRGQVGLGLALRDGSFKAAEALWAHPQLDVDAPNNAGETPLMFAAMKGELEWAKRLIARGAKVNRPGWSPMHYAALAPDAQMLRLMLAQGGELEARSPNGTTPLMMAARNGDERSVDFLLQRGADPMARNQQGLRASDMARSQDRDYLADRLKKLER